MWQGTSVLLACKNNHFFSPSDEAYRQDYNTIQGHLYCLSSLYLIIKTSAVDFFSLTKIDKSLAYFLFGIKTRIHLNTHSLTSQFVPFSDEALTKCWAQENFAKKPVYVFPAQRDAAFQRKTWRKTTILQRSQGILQKPSTAHTDCTNSQRINAFTVILRSYDNLFSKILPHKHQGPSANPETKQKFSCNIIHTVTVHSSLFSTIIIIMMNPRVLYYITLLVLACSQPTVITNQTTVAAYALTCSLAPVSNLGLCNNTCFTCRAGSYLCATCSTPFVLSHMACLVDNNIHTYKVHRYLNQLNLASMAADISNFYFADTGVALNVTKVIEVCRANLYESFAAGLFKITEVISLGYLYENKIDRISIKFNFMAVISSVTLVVDINGESYYVNEFDIFSDLSGRYGIDSNTSAPGYLFLDALSGSTADSIFYEVDTGLMSIMAQKVEIQIYIKSAAPVNTYSWGFNDVVVVTRACETCVSQAVSDLIDKVVLLIWIVTIMVAALILLLFTFIKIQAIKRRLDFQEKLGSTSSNHNLPLKALNRLSQSLKRSVTTMQKEFKKQDRRFMKLMKRQ